MLLKRKRSCYICNVLIFYLLIFLLNLGCEQDHTRAIYKPSKIDSLDFLVSNSDAIVFIEIFDSLSEKDKGIPERVLEKLAKAKCYEAYKGNVSKGSIITISNSTVYNKPSSVSTFLALPNGSYIAFLSKSDGNYKPLTPYSLIEINFGQGRPIWKQTDSQFVDRPELSKDEIVKDIKNAIGQ